MLFRSAAAGDLADFARRAHSLKSTAAGFGAAELSSLARAAEDAGRAGDADRVRELAPRIAGQLARLLAEVQSRLEPPA